MDANKQPVLRDLYQPKSEFKLSALRTDMERKYFLHEIPYSDAQRKYHNLVKNRLLGFKHDELLMTQHAPAARIDVFSIASGVLSVRNEVGEKTGQILKIDARDKKRKLLQVIDKALNGKALILISLLEVIQDVADYLFRNGIKFALITGAINSAKVRDNICNAFNKDPQLRVIIASPKSVSYNTRLGGMCNTVIWYGGNMTGYVAYKQASDRMNATAHKEIHVHHIVSTPSSGQGFDYISLQREMKSLDIKEFYKSMQISSDY
jgi:SNF2 family DNA or RNA helicase